MRWFKALCRLPFDMVSVLDPIHFGLNLRRSADTARARRRIARAGAHMAPNVLVVAPERLTMDIDSSVQGGCTLHCGGMEWSKGQGRIRLGARSYIGHGCVIYGAGNVEIGADVLVGPGVIITSQGHSFDDLTRPIKEQSHVLAPIRIEDDVWIGAGSLILPGVHIQKGAVIAAGAVVNHDVGAYDKVAGVPARLIGSRTIVKYE